ncbi:class I SAM-dependent methyltransferase [Xanthomonas arboricola]|uniref:class I SAM-dependent methyltransferase n=1 Tax=Xanthomonas arboricola TaxID=56448 RepID=UPI000CEEFEAE|nr:class I SAM-dependent methyltransferase [Xanthomonas arboricola]MBB6573988.1 SAM-dependent methyltransferase [Xanthomonas arboricola]PPT89286.1 SAM-dependent methyltransferase [Xanthomonas arboricola]
MGLIDRDFALDSGERVIALKIDDIPPDHMARYEFARQSLIDLPGPLLGADIFCGGGYGTHLLAQGLPCFIIGIDGSGESIARASQTYVDLNLMFAHKFFPFALPAEHFDFIVSMESIEHVENGALFFGLMVYALKPGGRLIISAPNASVIDLARNPYAWHYKHFTVNEILELGRQHQLTLISWHGADCTIVDASGKVVATNHHSPLSGTLREGQLGDTQTYYFQKPL